jgi:hypothetical protein
MIEALSRDLSAEAKGKRTAGDTESPAPSSPVRGSRRVSTVTSVLTPALFIASWRLQFDPLSASIPRAAVPGHQRQHWMLSFPFAGRGEILLLLLLLGPGVHTASNRNEYQKQTNNVSGE